MLIEQISFENHEELACTTWQRAPRRLHMFWEKQSLTIVFRHRHNICSSQRAIDPPISLLDSCWKWYFVGGRASSICCNSARLILNRICPRKPGSKACELRQKEYESTFSTPASTPSFLVSLLCQYARLRS